MQHILQTRVLTPEREPMRIEVAVPAMLAGKLSQRWVSLAEAQQPPYAMRVLTMTWHPQAGLLLLVEFPGF